mgnify:CR=1 FL=1
MLYLYILIFKIYMKRNRVALITGITGQDGSYLAEFLLNKKYIVHGTKRRSSSINTQRIDHIYEEPQFNKKRLQIHYCDLSDFSSIYEIIKKTQPDEVYNLAAQSHVAVSFVNPEYTSDINALGTLRILEAIKHLNLEKKTKFYQASSSELYGLVQETPQTEKTPFYPRSPYAVAKLFAYWITVNYRESYNMFACNGILFNHESKRRGETFVTRKITIGLSKIIFGLSSYLYLGNLDSKRDWGHAKDYVEMQWLILQQKKPEDFVISTGKQMKVRDFLKKCAKFAGIELSFTGKGIKETGYIKKFTNPSNKKISELKVGQTIIKVDPRYYRLAEVDTLLGNSSKARNKLKWKPKITIDMMIEEMMQNDLIEAEKQIILKKNGF